MSEEVVVVIPARGVLIALPFPEDAGRVNGAPVQHRSWHPGCKASRWHVSISMPKDRPLLLLFLGQSEKLQNGWWAVS